MKVVAYSYRPDEEEFFSEFAPKYGIELTTCRESLTLANADLAAGADCVSILTTRTPADLIDRLYGRGVRLISTRTIGYDHIDVEHCKQIGMRIANVSYAPESVADYTIMLMLMATRRMKHILERFAVQDFSLKGVRGKVLSEMTVGIVGTGRIGETVIRHLSGFGCRILCSDVAERESCRRYARYVGPEEIFRECDLISLHAPLNEQTERMINRESIARMKDGVILVNTARGALVDGEALVEGLESGKVGAAALDVVEDESLLYYTDQKYTPIANRTLALLRSFPNVILTPHTAFYTDRVVSDMVENSLKSCMLYAQGKPIPWEK